MRVPVVHPASIGAEFLVPNAFLGDDFLAAYGAFDVFGHHLVAMPFEVCFDGVKGNSRDL